MSVDDGSVFLDPDGNVMLLPDGEIQIDDGSTDVCCCQSEAPVNCRTLPRSGCGTPTVELSGATGAYAVFNASRELNMPSGNGWINPQWPPENTGVYCQITCIEKIVSDNPVTYELWWRLLLGQDEYIYYHYEAKIVTCVYDDNAEEWTCTYEHDSACPRDCDWADVDSDGDGTITVS